ncbi:hypothetical protein [Soonwooa purpurea]
MAISIPLRVLKFPVALIVTDVNGVVEWIRTCMNPDMLFGCVALISFPDKAELQDTILVNVNVPELTDIVAFSFPSIFAKNNTTSLTGLSKENVDFAIPFCPLSPTLTLKFGLYFPVAVHFVEFDGE